MNMPLVGYFPLQMIARMRFFQVGRRPH
jgi:hypothetical protein